MRVLIIDDDAPLRRILSFQLTRAGHVAEEAADGQAAWEQLQHEPSRLVITDWMMPRIDGPELIRRIRTAGFPSYTYIIMLTAKEGKSDVIQGLEAGADDYLTKPFNAGELLARVAIGERILKLEARLSASLARLEELATHDSLTGLLNRRALYTHAEAELSRSHRDGSHVSLILLDIDHFKSVNDQHGHHIGDQALRLVANVLTHQKRPYDWVGRWGGEEFLLVLPGTTLPEAGIVAERMRTNIAAASLALADSHTLQLQVSLGVTSTSLAASSLPTFDTSLHQADEALYCAKRAGRNRVCLFENI